MPDETMDTEIPEEDNEQPDLLELSDEEFAKLPEPVIDEAPQEETVVEPEVIEPQEDGVNEETPGEGEVDPAETDEEKAKAKEETDPAPKEDSPDGADPDIKEGDDTQAVNEETKTADSEEPAGVDFKLEYEKLMAPFKANGVDMQAKNAEDAIQLMKMGAGFHKKMAALKPNLRQMKLLEKNGLLDDEKLNYLIDIHNKNPEAIAKLLKDSNMDPMDINVKAESNYTPTNRTVSDTELSLDSVLDDIRETPSFQRTLNVVSKEWDDASQKTIATEPNIITTINGHIADGTYDKVMERVTYERNLGRLTGVSDLEAYKQAGNALADAGVLYRTDGNPPPVTPASVQPPKVEPSKKEVERKKKKRAASPTKGSRTTAEPTFDPLDLSDEDFAKLDINKYINAK